MSAKPKSRPVGECRLCHLTRPLSDSHYLPKKLYSFVTANQLKNAQPVMSVKGELKQVSDQYRGYVFCESCEAKLNHGGESWVIKQVPREYGGRFPLRDVLLKLPPSASGEDVAAYDVSSVGSFDLPKLLYFGFSIFWRAAVHRWATTSGELAEQIDLGEFQDPLRLFLLGGTAPTSPELVLSVDVWRAVDVLPALFPVIGEQHEGFQRFWFYIPGLVFLLWVGKNIPSDASSSSLASGTISADFGLAKSILAFTSQQLKSQKLGPRMPDMMTQIEKVRVKPSPNS